VSFRTVPVSLVLPARRLAAVSLQKCWEERRRMPRIVPDDEVAKHDNTLEPDPDPIVNGDDVGAAVGLPIKRNEIPDEDDEEGDDSSVTEKKQEPDLEDR
jgi:hypothetical protein